MNHDHDTNASGSESLKRHSSYRWMLLLLGVVAGIWFFTRFGSAAGTLISEVKKLTAVMSLINNEYVDKPDLGKLTEGAIEGMLKRLDPHSVYIPAVEQKDITEKDQGEFQGIGISFIIQNELITVIAPIPGTPADRLGIRSGDRIVEIDGVSAFGITNDEVFKKLRGPKGTTVKVTVIRDGVDAPLAFDIIRDTIPIHSVWTSFMLDDSTGYVLINQFTANTTVELMGALRRLNGQGMTRLLLDLRNNQGGRLNEAVSVADLFLPGGCAIVSRKGRHSEDDTTYFASDNDGCNWCSLIVLINGGSASASEIVAGAMQDLDRGLIVGENSFGKGLVQLPYQLEGGAVIRLSTAHWLTPSGRLVQRPYDKGRGEYYANRYRDPDSTKVDSLREAFKTKGGRTVYASAGIDPDVKVEEQTITGATARLINAQIPFQYASKLVQEYKLTSADDFKRFRDKFQVTEKDLKGLLDLAKEKKAEVAPEAWDRDRGYVASLLKSEIAQMVWNNRDYYYLIRSDSDPVVKKARDLFGQARMVAGIWLSARKG